MLSYNGEIIKSVRRLSTLLLVLLLGISVFLTSCGTPNDSGSKDVETLEAIYEQSNWKFRQSSANIQVYDKGNIKISIKGEATERTPGGDEFAWIPIALLKNRPEYYALEENSSPRADLTAYQIKDGLWSVVAFVPGTEQKSEEEQNAVAVANDSTNEANENSKVRGEPITNKIDINILIVSPDFATSLPLYLPIGQGIASVDTSVELVSKAKFIDYKVDPFENKTNDESVDLTEFSPLLSDGKVKALTKLDPSVAMLWDLSNVQYKSYKSWFQIFAQRLPLLSSLLIYIGIVELFFLLCEKTRKKREKSRKDFLKSRKDFHNKLTEDFDRYGEEFSWSFDRYKDCFDRYRENFDSNFRRPIEDFEIFLRDFEIFLRDFSRYERDFSRYERDFSRYERDFSRYERDFSSSFRRPISPQRIYLKFLVTLSHSFVSRLIIYGIIILLIVTLFLPLVALSQDENRTIEDPQRFCFEQLSSSTLCLEDFSLTVPSPNLKEDETILKLNLLPINVDKEKKVVIDFNDLSKNIIISDVEKIDKNNNFENTDVDSSKKVISITNFPDKFIKLLEQKLKSISKSDRSLSEIIESVNGDNVSKEPVEKAYENYQTLISSIDAKHFEIKISLKNTRVNQETRVVERIQIGMFDWIINREMHLFPFDANSLDIPISLKDAQAVLSEFIFVEPENYKDAVVTFHDIAAETDLISGSRSSLKKKSPYPIVYSDKKFRIDVQLSRIDGFSRSIIFWIIPTALIIGIAIEISSGIIENNFVKTILTISLPVAVSLFWGFVTWIHDNNPDVSYLFKSGLPTIIEPFALIGCIIFLLTFFTCLFANQKYKVLIRWTIAGMSLVALLSSAFKGLSLVNSFIGIIGLLMVTVAVIMFIRDILCYFRTGLSLSSSSYRWQLDILVLLLGILLTISAAASGFSHLSSLENIASSNDATLSIFFNLIKVTFVPFSDQIL